MSFPVFGFGRIHGHFSPVKFRKALENGRRRGQATKAGGCDFPYLASAEFSVISGSPSDGRKLWGVPPPIPPPLFHAFGGQPNNQSVNQRAADSHARMKGNICLLSFGNSEITGPVMKFANITPGIKHRWKIATSIPELHRPRVNL
jgi:hypothetical protein